MKITELESLFLVNISCIGQIKEGRLVDLVVLIEQLILSPTFLQ